MSEGLIVYGESGEILIDSNSMYYGLVKSGRLKKFNNANNWPGYYERTPSPSEAQQLYRSFGIEVPNAVAPVAFTTNGLVQIGAERVSGVWRMYFQPRTAYDFVWPSGMGNFFYPDGFYHFNIGYGYLANLPVGAEVPDSYYRIYIFDLMRGNKEKIGLETYDANGEVTFNSNMYPLRIAATVSPPPMQGWRPYSSADGFSSNDGYNTVSATYASQGLVNGRQYAAHTPHTRGANIDSRAINTACMEAIVAANNRVGFCWRHDYYSMLIDLEHYDSYVWNANSKRVPYALVDVTDLPFPFNY